MRVAETFQIAGRGVVVAVDETSDLPVGKKLVANIIKPDGTTRNADAWKEWLLRRSPKPIENEAFLVIGLALEDVPIGSQIYLSVAD